MNKKEKQLLSATLDKALAPPRKRPPLDDLLKEYDDGVAMLPQTAVPQYRSTAVPQSKKKPKENVIVDAIKEAAEEPTDNLTALPTAVPQYRSTAVPQLPVSSDFGPTTRFYRKPNNAADSLDRNLTPAESKVFDHMLRLTIGFNRDWCQVTVSTLMERTGYRSDKTIRGAITGLILKGLVARRAQHNNPQGDEYQILDYSGTGVPEYRSSPVKNTAVLESKITGVYLNTCKNMSDDTHTLQTFTQHIAETARELMGGELPDSPQEQERWKDCACVLMDELRKAASLAEGISSLPAFFAEHLKRRFSQKAKESGPVRKKNISSPAIDAADDEPGKEKSAFSLEECLAYADHLKNTGQGITNPGGYGTTIYRTGEADTLVEEWLKTKDAPKLEVESCPDCGGSGFVYVDALTRDKGVRKCSHPNLRQGYYETKH